MRARDQLIAVVFAITGIIGGAAYYATFSPQPEPIPPSPLPLLLPSNVTVHFMDVGQGDYIFIDTPDLDMLIDGGTKGAGPTVVEYLRALQVTRIDLVIATHPDSDHIGGLITVLTEYNVTCAPTVVDSRFAKDTNTHRDYMALAQQRTVENASRGQVFVLHTYVNVTVLNPTSSLEFHDANENSIVLRMQVLNVTFLFTGDSEVDSEASILGASLSVTSIILKVGHHGSRTSTSLTYLEAVGPEVAVISVGEGNRYEHKRG
jgi:competence protein ComEC